MHPLPKQKFPKRQAQSRERRRITYSEYGLTVRALLDRFELRSVSINRHRVREVDLDGTIRIWTFKRDF